LEQFLSFKDQDLLFLLKCRAAIIGQQGYDRQQFFQVNYKSIVLLSLL